MYRFDKEILTFRKMVVVPWEREGDIVPSLEFPFTRNPNKLIKQQVFVWVVSDQPRLWLTRIPKTQVVVAFEEGCTWLPLWLHHGVHMQQV